jgi:hypothetical protein
MADASRIEESQAALGERRKCDELTETGCGGPRPASECQGNPRRGGIRAWRDDVVPRMIQDRRCEK